MQSRIMRLPVEGRKHPRTLLDGPLHQFISSRAEFTGDSLAMSADRFFGKTDALRDVTIGEALADEPKHLQFSLGQRFAG